MTKKYNDSLELLQEKTGQPWELNAPGDGDTSFILDLGDHYYLITIDESNAPTDIANEKLIVGLYNEYGHSILTINDVAFSQIV